MRAGIRMTDQLCRHGRKVIVGYICQDCSIQDRLEISHAILEGFDKGFKHDQ